MIELIPEIAWQIATGGPWPDPDQETGETRFMALALREGLRGVGLSSPNPPVGCVLAQGGRVIGRGAHTRAGDPHGEIMALRDAEAREEETRGATAYVTLEPCCHHGRTPPCTDALIQAGVTRVVVGARDPNPRVDGGGIALLRAHGIAVEEGLLGEVCARFHAPFFKLIRTGLPWVSLKLALGSDGAIGPACVPTEVTPVPVQKWAHALRRASDAILVGRHTVAVDDPQLTDRWPEPPPPYRLFRRVVLDPKAQLPPTARAWQPIQGQPALRALIQEAPPLKGVEDLVLPPADHGCSLRHLLHELAARGVGRLLVEGGPTLAQALLAQGLVDEFHRFQSERPVGGTQALQELPAAWTIRTQAAFAGGRWERLA